MSRLYINPTIQKMIEEYCRSNGIDDLNAFANRCALQGLSILKFGTSPSNNVQRENNGVIDYDKKEIKKIKSYDKSVEEALKESHINGCDETKRTDSTTTVAADKKESIEQKERTQEERSIRRTIKLIKKS